MRVSNMKCFYLICSLFVLIGAFYPNSCSANTLQGSKIMVVMSYSRQNISEIDIRSGIEEVIGDRILKYFYLNTKKRPQDGASMAIQAYDFYKTFKPDVIIAADDNAQSMFIVPYIVGKESTPVVFCGVNDSADKYKYPASQVTGILEKKHYLQTINFAKLIDTRMDTVAVIYKDNPSNHANITQINNEKMHYGIDIVDQVAVANQIELEKTLSVLNKKADALLVLNLSGILDKNGKKINRNDTIQIINNNWKKLTMAASKSEIAGGLLCAVAKVNTEQGIVAAQIAEKIIQGTPVGEIPITENRNGQRLINISTAKNIGIKLKPISLLGAQLLQ